MASKQVELEVGEKVRATYKAEPQFVGTGEPVSFKADVSGDYTSLQWDFGDEIIIDDRESLPHVFALPGKYDVVLTVIGSGADNITTFTRTIEVVETISPDL